LQDRPLAGAAGRSAPPGVVNAVGELAARCRLPSDAAPRLARLLQLIVSDPMSPTTVRDPQAALDDHLADSLVALELSVLRAASTVADLGAGAGFPGLPLAIALPGAEVALVESNGRKCAFMERAITACGIANACPIQARAEEWPEGIDAHDLVTARALAPLSVVAEYAAPLLRIGGSLVAWRGRRDPDGEAEADRAAAELGLELRDVVEVRPYPAAQHRHLHVLEKVRDTPDRFPRRPGAARKRPLGMA
jgi:16S rRNA (guanine527-N7)-methyltransferase